MEGFLDRLYMDNKGEEKMMMSALIIKNRVGLSIISVLLMTFTSVTAYAEEGRFVFSDLTVTDKSTGLVWARDANIANKSLKWDEAIRFLKQLNGEKYGGYSDWRLPTRDELQTLIDYAKSRGYISDFSDVFNRIGFKNVQVFYYWSSTSNPYDTADMFGITMFNGGVNSGDKKFTSYNIWPVRGGK